MKSIECNGSELVFYSLIGEVVYVDQETRAHVDGSGGGTSTNTGLSLEHGSKYIKDISLSTNHEYRREIWIKDESGKENPVKMNNESIKVREGNYVTVAFCIKDDEEEMVLFQNHDTQKSFEASAKEIAEYFDIDVSSNVSGIGALVFFNIIYVFILGMVIHSYVSSEIAFLALFFLVILSSVSFVKKGSKKRKKKNMEIESNNRSYLEKIESSINSIKHEAGINN